MNFKVGHKVYIPGTPHLVRTIMRIEKWEWNQRFSCVLKCDITGDTAEYWYEDICCTPLEQQYNDFLDKIKDRIK